MSTPFHVDQRVRLVADVPPVAAGAEGVVIGFYARERMTWAVCFDGALYEVAPEHLAPVEERPPRPTAD